MFTDNKCVNANCQEEDTEYHLFYSNCFIDEKSVVKPHVDYNNIFSSNVSQQKIVKDIIIEQYQRRLNLISSSGRSNWSGLSPQDQRMKCLLVTIY